MRNIVREFYGKSLILSCFNIDIWWITSVSYTHLDVYKRQALQSENYADTFTWDGGGCTPNNFSLCHYDRRGNNCPALPLPLLSFHKIQWKAAVRECQWHGTSKSLLHRSASPRWLTCADCCWAIKKTNDKTDWHSFLSRFIFLPLTHCVSPICHHSYLLVSATFLSPPLPLSLLSLIHI